MKIFTQSAADFLDEWFESPEVKVTLATDGVIGANGGPRSPGTAYILLHHCMGGVNGHRGLWGFVRGGMGAVSEAIASAARGHGAIIRTNAPVDKVLVRNGRARGVVLEDGEEIEAALVASNLDPKLTFLRLVEEGELPPDFVSAMRKFRIEGTSARSTWRCPACPSFARFPARRDRSTGPPCTSVHRSNMWSVPGTTRSTAARRPRRCSS